ncbi:MAG: RNA repair transcriptional activator RtcR [Planctomycetaceae bacterium]
MKTTVIGYLGSQLDGRTSADRWNKWRPTVSICQHEDFLVDRFELLIDQRTEKLAEVVVEDLKAVSPETDVRVHEVSFDDPWDFEEVYGAMHDFARGYKFETEKENYLLHITTGTHVFQICSFLLAESRHIPAQLLQTAPPKGNERTVHGHYKIIDLDLSRYDRLAARFEQEQRSHVSFLKAGIETRNRRFNELIDRIEFVALQSDSPMLLTGPTGAGKSRLAKRIYELKRQNERVTGDLVEVNCAMLRGDQAMSTLFGHRKGAFTGAAKDRPGLLRSANEGLLFLDEIGELGLDEQAMLLRALEEKRFLPVGADEEISSDFQLIAGTNRNLREHVRSGKFREDLLARIDLWSFELPGLTDRREDIEPNVEFELVQFNTQSGRQVRFNKEARAQFLRFATSPSAKWRANFRDLNAAMTRMATLSPTGRIGVDTVTEEIARLTASWGAPRDQSALTDVPDFNDSTLDEFDRHQLAHIVAVCRTSDSLADAGRKLFNVSRLAKKQPNDSDRLRKYLAKFGLTFADATATPDAG